MPTKVRIWLQIEYKCPSGYEKMPADILKWLLGSKKMPAGML